MSERNDLFELEAKDYVEKYKVSLATYYRRKKLAEENKESNYYKPRTVKEEQIQQGEKEIEIQTEVKAAPKLEEMIAATNFSDITDLLYNISDLNSMMKGGLRFYMIELSRNVNKHDKMLTDINHMVELTNISDEESVKIIANMKEIMVKRRLNKDEYNFIDNNYAAVEALIGLLKASKKYNDEKKNRRYYMRELGESVGKTMIQSVNLNAEEEAAKEYLSAELSEKFEERFVALETYRIKNTRKTERLEGKTVYVDKIIPSWPNDINKLDTITKDSLIEEANRIFEEGDYIKLPKVKELIIKKEIMPKVLFTRGYFLREEQA